MSQLKLFENFKGWTKPGPIPTALKNESHIPDQVEDQAISCDSISGHYRIFQYLKGHRYSTDDLLVAWYASTYAPIARTVLDLGSGIGSVAQMVAWRLPGSMFTTIEAQERSYRLAQMSVQLNDLDSRFNLILGDMREVTQKWSDENLNQKFDLITSSPPYFPLETGVLGDHPQKIECRFETRGGIEAYAQAASPWLAPGGMFFTIMPTLQEKRTLTALAEVGMFVVRSRAIITQEGESSLLSVYAAAKESDYPVGFKPESLGTHYRDEPLVIRLKDGRVSPEYLRVKGMMGFPPTH